MAGRATSRVLIGRAREKEQLNAAFRVAAAGSAVTALVIGEAGIGKSRLVHEFVREVGDEAVVLSGGCLDERVPYLPIADALRSLLRSGWRPNVRDEWSDLDALLPELTGDSSDAPRQGDSPGRLQHRFLRFLETVGGEGPVILVVEDLHWSDASTRNLLMYVLRSAGHVPLLVVGTYRSDELTRQHPVRPFLAELSRLPLAGGIELGRFHPDDVAEMLMDITGHRPTAQTVEDVHARCGGNPFLVEEVIAAGLTTRVDRLPRRLQDILLARAARLSPDATEVLRTAAVGGRHVDDRLLRKVCTLAPERVDGALRELLDAHLLEADADSYGYAFRHALSAEAVYDDALPGERVRLHAGYAEALDEDPDLASSGGTLAALERAQHWHRARRTAQALPAWVEAATAAERVYAYPEALAAYESALELWPAIESAEALTGVDEVELARRAAEAANWAVAPARALTLAEHALALIDARAEPMQAAVLLERLGRYAWLSGLETEALAYYERGVELAPARPATPELARVLAGHAHIQSLSWLDDGAADRAREAIQVARQVGAVVVEAHALTTLALAEGNLGDEGAAVSSLAEAARLIYEVQNDENIWRLWVNRPFVLFSLGLIEEAAAIGPQMRAAVREVGLERSAAAHAIVNEALPLLELGRWHDARLLLDAEISVGTSEWWHLIPLQVSAWLNWLTGDIDGAERDLAAIRRVAPDIAQIQYVSPQAQAVAAVAIETRRWQSAVEAVAHAVRTLPRAHGHPVAHWEPIAATWLGLWAAAELVVERGAAGGVWLAPFLADFDDLLASAALRPPDRRPVRHRALLALCDAERARVDGTMSSDVWHHAVVETDALGAVPQRAYARARYAEALLGEGGDRAEATRALNEAVTLFADVPRAPIRLLAEQIGRRARLRLTVEPEAQQPARQTPLGLTAREQEVLRLVAEARTNREIGEALFMSPKTASVHVSSVMRKLGVNRRADAARLAKQVLGDT